MTKVLVLYYSSYGHLETMANAVAEGAKQFQFAVNVLRRTMDAFADQEIEEVLLGQHERPGQIGYRDTLRCSARAESAVHFLNFDFGFGEQPVAEMAVDVVTALVQFAGGYFAKATGALGGEQPVG